MIDPTVLDPPSWWYVPGVTPSIYNSDPDSLDAFKTTDKRMLALKPGKYKFISFTFDFPFSVNLDGKLEFAHFARPMCGGTRDADSDRAMQRTYPYGGTTRTTCINNEDSTMTQALDDLLEALEDVDDATREEAARRSPPLRTPGVSTP